MKNTLIILTLFFFSFSFSQEYNIEDAKVSTKTFLDALKISDIPEGQEILNGILFKKNSSLPILSNYNILYEKIFNTDIDNVKGYKSLIEITGNNKIGNKISKRYMLISYLDKTSNTWKILEFRENLNIENEIVSARSSIFDKGDSRRPQYRYRGLAYWEFLGGKIQSAYDNILKAESEAKKVGDENFKASNKIILKKIM
jgi:hypothetical protein